MAVPPPSPSDKPALRVLLRERRQRFVHQLIQAEQLAASADAAAANAQTHIPAGAAVALYHATGSELDAAPLAKLLRTAGHVLALPHVLRDGSGMRFLRWMPGVTLEQGAFGIGQPAPGEQEIVPDCVVTPLLGFDRAGRRLGQGAAFYDRAFAGLPHARRIGYGWSVQELDCLPHDEWDIGLHAIATERAWIECGPSGA